MRGARLFGALLLATALSACDPQLDISHSETRCIHPGDRVTLNTDAPAGSLLTYMVQDDFGGSLSPDIAPTTVGSSGQATVVWQSPHSISTTTVHFLLHAAKGNLQTRRDLHVRVKPAGDSC